MDTLDLISAIANNDALETEAAFKQVMADKISAKLDDMRMNIASTIFTNSEVEENEETE
jgi:hypothetical protein